MPSPPEADPSPTAEAPRAPGRTARGAAWSALLVLVAFGSFWLLRDRSRDGELQLDEAEWLCMSVHTWQLLRTGESADAGATEAELREAAEDPWKLGIQYSTFGWMNPLLPKLVLGVVAETQGLRQATRKVFPRFTQGRPQERERARARFLPALGAARVLTAALAAVIAALLFHAGARLGGAPAGVAAYALWLVSPAAREAATHVRTDLFPLVFALAALVFALGRTRALAGAEGRGALLGAAAVLGLLAGLAVGSKLNGALTAFAVALWIPAVWLAHGRPLPALRGPLTGLAVAGAIALLLFALLEPAVWSADPIAGVRELLARWKSSTGYQQRGLVGEVAIARTLGERLELAWAGTFGRDEPWRALTGLPGGVVLVLAGAWVVQFGTAQYGVALPPVDSRGRGGETAQYGAAQYGVALPLVASREREGDTRRDGREATSGSPTPYCALPGRLVLLAWVGVTAVGTTLWLPIDWPRFFLPYLPVMILLEALLVGFGWRRAAARVRKR